MRKFIVAVSLVASGLITFGVTNIANAAEGQQIVRYLVRDLSTAGGVRKLYGRLGDAAASLCGNYQAVELQRSHTYLRCVHESVTRAVAQINDARLTRYHELRTNSAVAVARN